MVPKGFRWKTRSQSYSGHVGCSSNRPNCRSEWKYARYIWDSFTAEQAKALGGINFEGWEYYSTEIGEHPNQSNFTTWNSIEPIAGFYSPHFAHLIAPRPVLMIAGTA